MAWNGVQLMRIACEHSECSATVKFEDAHSAVAVLQKVDTNGYQFFQCEDGQEVNSVTYQHWHCSREHLLVNFAACINGHYNEGLLHHILPGQGSTILHKIVLGGKLKCKVCQVPLVTQAYRFCLTHCTPQNSVPDDSLNDLGEWCCTLEHARQSVLKTIDSISGGG